MTVKELWEMLGRYVEECPDAPVWFFANFGTYEFDETKVLYVDNDADESKPVEMFENPRENRHPEMIIYLKKLK